MPAAVGTGEAPDAALVVRGISAHVPRVFFDAERIVAVRVRFFAICDVLVFPVDALLTVSGFVLASSVADAELAVFNLVARGQREGGVFDVHDGRRRRAGRVGNRSNFDHFTVGVVLSFDVDDGTSAGFRFLFQDGFAARESVRRRGVVFAGVPRRKWRRR